MDSSRFSNPLVMAFIATVICTLFSLAYSTIGCFDNLYPISLLLYAPLTNIIHQLFLRKQRNTKSLIILSSILVLAMESLIFIVDRGQSILRNVMALPVLVSLEAFSIKLVLKPIRYNSLLRIFDFSVIFYLVTVILISMNSYTLEESYLAISGVALAFLGVLVARNRLSKVPILLIISVLIVFVTMQAMGLSEYVREGVDALINLFSKFVESFMGLIARIMALLPSIPHKRGGNLIPVVSDSSYRVSDVVAITVSARILSITTVVVTLVVSILIAIRLLGRKKIGRHGRRQDARGVGNDGITFFKAIGKSIKAVKRKLTTRKFLHVNRNNSLGLYFLMEKKFGRTQYARMKDETPMSFISRCMQYFPSGLQPWGLVVSNDMQRYLYSSDFLSLPDLVFASQFRKELYRICVSMYWVSLRRKLSIYRIRSVKR